MKKRNRLKQTTTLEERLSRFTTDLRQQARTLDPGTEEAKRLRKRTVKRSRVAPQHLVEVRQIKDLVPTRPLEFERRLWIGASTRADWAAGYAVGAGAGFSQG
jgi:hypothetical protein